MIHLLSTSSPYIVFLFIPLFYSGITTHKQWLCLLNMSIIFIYNIFILFTNHFSYIDIWLYIVISIIIISHKTNLSFYFPHTKHNLLNKDENEIYNKFFTSPLSLSKEQFKYFFSKGKLSKIKGRFTFIKNNSRFDKIYFFVKISNEFSVQMQRDNYTTVSYVKEGSWIGVINYERECLNETVQKWLMEVKCINDTAEIWYYEWNVQSIRNIFAYNTDISCINRLLLLWNQYIASDILCMENKEGSLLLK